MITALHCAATSPALSIPCRDGALTVRFIPDMEYLKAGPCTDGKA